MSEAPEYGDVIREAFFVEEAEMEIELAEATTPKIPGPEGPVEFASPMEASMRIVAVKEIDSAVEAATKSSIDLQSALVELPEEAQQLDEDIREAIARMTAKVEGKA